MKAEECFYDRVVLLRVADRTLLLPPDWDEIAGLRREEVAWVALDLMNADFISSLFVRGCVELGSTLARRGKQLVLLHLSPDQKRVLELVPGASRLPVFDDERQFTEMVASAEQSAPDEGVTRAEKGSLRG